jgi:Cft2 family RNA processing exonuclease
MDAGVIRNAKAVRAFPLFDLIKAEPVDAIVISHCHHDHGSLSVAVHFPKAHVLMTELSYFLVERVLHNSVIAAIRQRMNVAFANTRLYP